MDYTMMIAFFSLSAFIFVGLCGNVYQTAMLWKQNRVGRRTPLLTIFFLALNLMLFIMFLNITAMAINCIHINTNKHVVHITVRALRDIVFAVTVYTLLIKIIAVIMQLKMWERFFRCLVFASWISLGLNASGTAIVYVGDLVRTLSKDVHRYQSLSFNVSYLLLLCIVFFCFTVVWNCRLGLCVLCNQKLFSCFLLSEIVSISLTATLQVISDEWEEYTLWYFAMCLHLITFVFLYLMVLQAQNEGSLIRALKLPQERANAFLLNSPMQFHSSHL